MEYTKDITKFIHKLWGEGILRDVENNALCIEFTSQGLKRISADSISKGLLTIANPETVTVAQNRSLSNNDNSLIQYDTSDTIVGNKNILDSFNSDDVVIFNESYVIVGEETTAKKISATYDLTIIGDIEVDEIIVNGELTVIGNITANKLTCANTFMCKGHVDSDYIFVGDIVANSVKCVDFICEGNALIKTTIDIDESSKTEKLMVAGEGIMGAGSFAALTAIANEYFEFSGEVQGKVVELESDKTLSEITVPTQGGTDLSKLPIKEVIEKFEQRLLCEYKQCSELDEGQVFELTKILADNTLHNLVDYATIFEALTNISYQDKIEDFSDYLTVRYAKKILPKEIYKYETIDHIDSLLLCKAEEVLEELEFTPKSVEQIAQCIQIVLQCAEDIPLETDCVLDKIFSSFGLRYSTVRNILGKDSSVIAKKEENANVSDANITDDDASSNMFEDEASKPKKFTMSKEKFLGMSIRIEAQYYGITADEQMRLASAGIKTCGEFLKMDENQLREIFKKKLFLANHLYQAQQKMKKAVEEMYE